jgi:hypothetical protein
MQSRSDVEPMPSRLRDAAALLEASYQKWRLADAQFPEVYADLIRASQGLLATLRRNAGHVEKGITPGTTSSQRAEARAFWPKEGK